MKWNSRRHPPPDGGYLEAKEPPLEVERFADYLLHRSRVDRTVTILLEDTSYQEDQNDLKGLPEGHISSWPHLKTAIE